jgi:hypothetical protein
MDSMLKSSVWQQFGAAIDTLDSAINLCPDHLWMAALWKDTEDERYGQFWFIVYHTLFWTDLYLTGSSDGFLPPPPFIRGKLPEIPYTKEQLCTYLDHCRRKCQTTIESLTDERANQTCTFNWVEASFLEMQLYSMRHVQEHSAQLNLMLGQHDISVNDWIPKALDKAY